jgi:hypothetical protein
MLMVPVSLFFPSQLYLLDWSKAMLTDLVESREILIYRLGYPRNMRILLPNPLPWSDGIE